MKAKIDAEIERLEAKMTERKKVMGMLYSFEMSQIDAQHEVLYRLRRE